MKLEQRTKKTPWYLWLEYLGVGAVVLVLVLSQHCFSSPLLEFVWPGDDLQLSLMQLLQRCPHSSPLAPCYL